MIAIINTYNKPRKYLIINISAGLFSKRITAKYIYPFNSVYRIKVNKLTSSLSEIHSSKILSLNDFINVIYHKHLKNLSKEDSHSFEPYQIKDTLTSLGVDEKYIICKNCYKDSFNYDNMNILLIWDLINHDNNKQFFNIENNPNYIQFKETFKNIHQISNKFNSILDKVF